MTAFIKNAKLWRNGIEFQVVSGDEEQVLLENVVTGARASQPTLDLLKDYVNGVVNTTPAGVPHQKTRAEIARPVDTRPRSNAAQLETQRRISYMVGLNRVDAFQGPMDKLKEEILKLSVELKEARPPHLTTVYRWRRKYLRAQKSAQALIVDFEKRGGKGNGRLHNEVECLIHEAIDTIFLASKTCSAEAVFNHVCLRISELNQTRLPSEHLIEPGLRTVQRRIEALYAFDLAVARYGRREAERRFANNLGARMVYRILELVEIDHTPIDLMVTNAARIVLGRPSITVILDRFSRCVLGYHLSLAGHGTPAVFEAIRHAMLPKAYLSERYADLNLQWPCYGWPERLVMDNGTEFHAAAVVQALLDLGIVGEYAASRDPNDKPFVERFLKTLNYSFIHRLPGTTLAKIHMRVGFKAEEEACITLEELDRIIHVWICNVYHQRPHAGLGGRAPLDVWKQSAQAFPPPLKLNRDDLDIVLSQVTDSKLQHYGIDLNTFVYVSPELLILRRILPSDARVSVKWPANEAGHIWVWHDIDKHYIKVPNQDSKLAGLTVEQAKAGKKLLKAPDNAYAQVGGQANLAIRGVTDAALADKKLKNRRRGARMDNQTSKDLREPKETVPVSASDETIDTFSTDAESVQAFDVVSPLAAEAEQS